MKYLTLLLLFSTLMLTSSCKYILIKYERVKQPTLENHESLSRFLCSKGIDTSEILCFKDTTALNTFYKLHLSVPEARFFNKEKKLLDYRNSIYDCNGMVSVFIEKVDSINLVTPIEGEYLDKYLESVVVESTGNPFTLENQKYEVYMVVYWAKYLGNVSKRKVYDWQEHVKKANQDGTRIRMILVDIDYQKFWGISKDVLPEFIFSSF